MSIKVTCAIIENEGKVLCAQRSEKMKHPHKWEFPGGKVEDDEDLISCLKREIKEELGVTIEVLEQLPTFTHSYTGNINITLFPFRCGITSGNIQLAEHQQIQWLTPENLKTLDWAAADVAVVDFINENSESDL